MKYLVHIQTSMGGRWNPECQEIKLVLSTLNRAELAPNFRMLLLLD